MVETRDKFRKRSDCCLPKQQKVAQYAPRASESAVPPLRVAHSLLGAEEDVRRVSKADGRLKIVCARCKLELRSRV